MKSPRCRSCCDCRGSNARRSTTWKRFTSRANRERWCNLVDWASLFAKQEDKTIYRKNLRRVMYVFGEVAGRPPADAIMDMELDRSAEIVGVSDAQSRPTSERTWLSPGGGVAWNVPANTRSNGMAKANGKSRWTCFAIWASRLPRPCLRFSCC